MKKAAYVVLAYGIIILCGGMIGYAKAHSVPSLIAGSISGSLTLISGFLMLRNYFRASYLAMILSGLLTAFFTYRLGITAKFMPAGMMALISLLVFMTLILSFKRQQAEAK